MTAEDDEQAALIAKRVLELLGATPSQLRRVQPDSRRGWFSGAGIGFLAAILVAMLVLPQRDDRTDGEQVASGPAAGALDATGSAGGVGTGPGAEAAAATGAPAVTGGGAGTASRGATGGGAAAGRVSATRSGTVTSTAPAGAKAAKGVTDDKIKLGFVVVDENPITGNIRQYYEAEIDRWRKQKLIPVHGRDVELVFYGISFADFTNASVSETRQRAACVDLGRDKKVFAVMGWGFPLALECLAREYKTPVIGSVGEPDEDLIRRSWPYFFYTNMASDRVLRNWPNWAHEYGYLTGRKIGILYSDNPKVKARVDKHFKPGMTQLGYAYEEQAVGSGQGAVALAVQRFQTAGVNTIFLMARPGEVAQSAEAQNYRPQYLVTDFETSSYTADATPVLGNWIPEQFHNATAMTYYRRAETGTADHAPIPAAGKQCEDNYFAFSGQRWRKDDPRENAAWDSLQHTCDQGRAVIAALAAAGRDLHELGLVAGLESRVKAQPSGEMADLTFSAANHDGANQFKTIKGNKDCLCWTNVHPFRNPWVD